MLALHSGLEDAHRVVLSCASTGTSTERFQEYHVAGGTGSVAVRLDRAGTGTDLTGHELVPANRGEGSLFRTRVRLDCSAGTRARTRVRRDSAGNRRTGSTPAAGRLPWNSLFQRDQFPRRPWDR